MPPFPIKYVKCNYSELENEKKIVLICYAVLNVIKNVTTIEYQKINRFYAKKSSSSFFLSAEKTGLSIGWLEHSAYSEGGFFSTSSFNAPGFCLRFG